MAKGSLRRYDVQAKVSLYISALAALLALMLLVLLLRNYKSVTQEIVYANRSIYGPIVFVLTALAILLGGAGAAMGAVSAEQKRNDLNRRSWLAFFVGGFTISLTIVLFYLFWKYRTPL